MATSSELISAATALLSEMKSLPDGLRDRLALSSDATSEDIAMALALRAALSSDRQLPMRIPQAIGQMERRVIREPRPPGEKPHVLHLGSATHEILALLKGNSHRLKDVLAQGVSFRGNGAKSGAAEIKKFTLDQPSPFARQLTFGESPETTPAPPATRTIALAVGLPAPQLDRSGNLPPDKIIEWATDILAKEFKALQESNGGIPTSPHEVHTLLQENDRGLLKILEVCHILLGDRPGISLVRNDRIVVGDDDVFRVLNLLSVARVIMEKRSFDTLPQVVHPNLKEMPIGAVPLKALDGETVSIPGGRCDWVSLTMDSQDGSPNFYLTHGAVTDRFHRRSRRHVHGDNLGRRKKDIENRVSRDFYAYFSELARIYGVNFFQNIAIQVIDFKVMGGDAGAYEGVNEEETPYPDHLDQVGGYLFLIAAQACRVHKKYSRGVTLDGPPEPTCVSVEEVVDFGIASGWFPGPSRPARLSGSLHYFLPQETSVKPFYLPESREALIEWGRRMVENRQSQIRRLVNEYLVLRALLPLLESSSPPTPPEPKKPSPLPDYLKTICGQILGKRYLVLSNLMKGFEPSSDRPLEVVEAIRYPEVQVFVFWLRGLKGKGVARLAVDLKRGRFHLSLGPEVVTGVVKTDQRKIAVSQRPATVREFFLEKVARCLPSQIAELSLASPQFIVSSTGRRRALIPGKPVICSPDPLTGKWIITRQLIDEARQQLGTLTADTFGVAETLEIVARRPPFRVKVRCPDPTHLDHRGSAQWVPPDPLTPGHLLCYRDHILFWVDDKVEFSPVPRAPADQVESYRPVSRSRLSDITAALQIGRICGRTDQTAADYLASRGLDPDGDVGPVGFVPPRLSAALADTARYPGNSVSVNFWGFITRMNFTRQRVDQLIATLKDGLEVQNEDYTTYNPTEPELQAIGEYLPRLEAVVGSLEFLPLDDLEEVLGLLTPARIDSLRSRSLVGRDKNGSARWGGRATQGLWWFGPDGRLVLANCNDRGVKKDGMPLFEGDKSHNMSVFARRRKPQLDEEGRLLLSTPKGIWVRDPQAFESAVRETRVMVVGEGWISMASLGRLIPSLKDNCFALCGSNAPILAAFLGRYSPGVLYAAGDFDAAGYRAYLKMKEDLANLMPDLEIRNVRELLPPEVALRVPTEEQLEALLEEAASETPGRNRTVSGGIKDWNDLLLKTRPGRKYRYKQRATHQPALLGLGR